MAAPLVLSALCLAAPALADEPILPQPMVAVGSIAAASELAWTPDPGAPLWIEVAGFVDDPTCSDCAPEEMSDLVWSGRAQLGEDGSWTAHLTRGNPALSSPQPIPHVDLRGGYALRVTAQLVTNAERCFGVCATRPLHELEACVDGCNRPEAWALSGTRWITTGRAHSQLADEPATVVVPEIRLERVVDRRGRPLNGGTEGR